MLEVAEKQLAGHYSSSTLLTCSFTAFIDTSFLRRACLLLTDFHLSHSRSTCIVSVVTSTSFLLVLTCYSQVVIFYVLDRQSAFMSSSILAFLDMLHVAKLARCLRMRYELKLIVHRSANHSLEVSFLDFFEFSSITLCAMTMFPHCCQLRLVLHLKCVPTIRGGICFDLCARCNDFFACTVS